MARTECVFVSIPKYFSVITALKSFIAIILITNSGSTSAQEIVDTAAIIKQLENILDRDQKTRKGIDSAAFIRYIDSTNLLQIETLIKKYGWPGKSFVGERGNAAVFFVIQHSDSVVQQKYFPLLQESVEKGESKPSHLALMHDRILMRQGKKQIYGSQVVFDENGSQIFYPIEDESNVNERRIKMGLQPIEEYAKHFGIDYKPLEK